MAEQSKLALSILLVCALAACGGGGGGAGGGDPSPDPDETRPTTEAPTQQGGQQVGQVIQVINSLTRVDEERAAGGDPLFAGSRMITDGQGRATFNVRDILEDCQVQPDSELTVSPSQSTPLELDRGSIICRSKPGEDEFQVDAGEAIVGFLDPIFLVTVGSQTDVRVDFGFVQVRQPDRRPARLVGPGSQISVGSGSMPSRGERFRSETLDGANAEALRRLRAGLPADSRGFPGARSQLLSRMKSAGALRVGFDEGGSDEVYDFVEDLTRVVAARWGVRPDAQAIDPEDAAEALQNGGLDAFVAPEAVPGAARIPLFGDEREREWFLMVQPDAGYQAALENVLKTILNNGEYGNTYFSDFGQMPTYEAVRSLVYPSREQAGRTQWRAPSASPTPPAEARVRHVTLTAEPSQYTGQCPTEVTFTGTITVASPGSVEYEYVSSDGRVTQRQSVGFRRAGTFDLDEETLEVAQSIKGWRLLHVPSQRIQSDQANYSVTCQEVPR